MPTASHQEADTAAGFGGGVLGERRRYVGAVVLSSFPQVLQTPASTELLREQELELGTLDSSEQDHRL